MTLTPTRSLTYPSTSETLSSFGGSFTGTGPKTLSLPPTDQAGWVDASGSAVTGWAYRIEGQWTANDRIWPFATYFILPTGTANSTAVDSLPTGNASSPYTPSAAPLGADSRVPVANLPAHLGKTALDVAYGVPKFNVPDLVDTLDAPLSTDVPTITKIAPSYTQLTVAGWERIPYTQLATPGLLAVSTANPTTPGVYGKQSMNTIGLLDMPYAAEWVMDGLEVGLVVIKTASGASAYPRFRIFVDGKPTTADVQIWTEAVNYTYPYIMKLTWGTAKTRRVRIELADAGIVGVDKLPTTSLYAPAYKPPRIAILGDSWVEGTLEAGDVRLDAMAWLLGRILNTGIYVNGYGGTGYVAGNASTPKRHFEAVDRVQNIYATKPNYVVVFGTINDNTVSSATLQAAASSLYAALATNLPKAKVIVVGSESYNTASNTGAQNITNRDAVKAAALAAPNVIGFIDPMAEAWITGTGTSTAVTGNGTADRFHNGATVNHLTRAGNRYYAERLAEKILTLVA